MQSAYSVWDLLNLSTVGSVWFRMATHTQADSLLVPALRIRPRGHVRVWCVRSREQYTWHLLVLYVRYWCVDTGVSWRVLVLLGGESCVVMEGALLLPIKAAVDIADRGNHY
ncbi:hypothetical protein M3J09_013756 [Ascochyta lentis]